MSAAALLDTLAAAGVSVALKPDGQSLALSGPRPAVDAWIDAIRAHKPELIRLLSEAGQERAAILEVDAGLSRPEAEARAALAHPPAPANEPTHPAWSVTRPDGSLLSVTRCPPVTRGAMERHYPRALVEPLVEPEPTELSAEDAALASAFLDAIGESDAGIRAEYAAALARWPHRLAGLYSECLRLGLATDDDGGAA